MSPEDSSPSSCVVSYHVQTGFGASRIMASPLPNPHLLFLVHPLNLPNLVLQALGVPDVGLRDAGGRKRREGVR